MDEFEKFEKFEKLKILKKAIDETEAVILSGKKQYKRLTLGTNMGIAAFDENNRILEFTPVLNESEYHAFLQSTLNSWGKRLEQLTKEFKELLNRKEE